MSICPPSLQSLIKHCWDVFKEVDLYNILEVNANAEIAEVKVAYYRLIRKYHSDKRSRDMTRDENNAAEEKTKLLNRLFHVMKTNREDYDRSRKTLQSDFLREHQYDVKESHNINKPPFFFYELKRKWNQMRFMYKVNLKSLVLTEGILRRLQTDIEEFLFPPELFCFDSNIIDYYPERVRCYLLHGNSGTGKSSFIYGMARKLNLHVYEVSMNNPELDDDGLLELFRTVALNSVIVVSSADIVLPTVCPNLRLLLNPLDEYNVGVNEDFTDSGDDDAEYDETYTESGDEWNKTWFRKMNDPEETKSRSSTSNEKYVFRADCGGESDNDSEESENDNNNSTYYSMYYNRSKLPRSGVTYDGLRKALKDAASHRGRVVFLESNSTVRVGGTPITQGIVDVKQHFADCNEKMVKTIFKLRYDGTSKQMCAEFLKRLRALSVQCTPVKLIQFLRLYQDDPNDALKMKNIKRFFKK